MTKYAVLTILFTLFAANTISNNNQLHAQVPTPLFSEQHALTNSINYPTSVFAIDLDGDSFADVLSASGADNKIAWFKNDGTGNFGKQQIITTNANYTQFVYATDLDNDGDNDVLSAYSNKIAWYANDGAGNFNLQQIITTNVNGANSVYATDLDNDGDNDVLFAASAANKIIWYPNDGAANFNTEQIITQSELSYLQALFIADIDNNGFDDIAVTDANINQLVWFKNNNTANFNEPTFAINKINYPNFKSIADLDADGDIDILYFNDTIINNQYKQHLFWAENDGMLNFTTTHDVYYSNSSGFSFIVSDVNNDGFNDIIMKNVSHNIDYLLNDGAGNFSFHQIEADNTVYPNIVNIFDMDNDGNKDIVFYDYGNHKMAYYKNNGNDTFNPQSYLMAYLYDENNINISDLNNDGYVDILYTDYASLSWRANNGDNTFSNYQMISSKVAIPKQIVAADVDNDGDNDILVMSDNSGSGLLVGTNKIAWYANNGNGTFAPEEIITTNVNEPKSIATADFDNDGDLDLASISFNDNKVAWYKNLMQPISNNPTNPTFTLFPNPANNQVTLFFIEPINANTKILLTDLSGKTVTIYNNPANNQSITINRRNLPKGLYFVQARNANTNQVLGVSKVVFE